MEDRLAKNLISLIQSNSTRTKLYVLSVPIKYSIDSNRIQTTTSNARKISNLTLCRLKLSSFNFEYRMHFFSFSFSLLFFPTFSIKETRDFFFFFPKLVKTIFFSILFFHDSSREIFRMTNRDRYLVPEKNGFFKLNDIHMCRCICRQPSLDTEIPFAGNILFFPVLFGTRDKCKKYLEGRGMDEKLFVS